MCKLSVFILQRKEKEEEEEEMISGKV